LQKKLKLLRIILLFILSIVFNFGKIVDAQSNTQYVTFEQFGAKGDGSDDTNSILLAFEFAKIKKVPIRLLGRNYRFSPKETINITGIPLFSGSGSFDLTQTGANIGNLSQKAIFHVEGSKKLLSKSIISCKSGNVRLQVGKNLSLKRNDILFITSSEPLINNKRPYYCKGQRCIVKIYDKNSGIVEFFEKISFDIEKAYVWLHDFIPEIHIEKGIKFITSPMNFLTCFRLYYAKGRFSGYYKNFSLTAVMFKSSFGIVEDMETYLPVTKNNGYSYGIEVSDMSDVLIKNCKLTGGRHVITSGGGGLWKKEESGGNGAAGYPATVVIDGGVYTGTNNIPDINENNSTIDSHGLAFKMVIRNSTIYGGVNLGANHVLIDNCVIYADSKRILNIGSDVIPFADWGHYTIKNSTFIADKRSEISSLILCKGAVNFLKLDNITIKQFRIDNILADFVNFVPKYAEFSRVSFIDFKTSKFLIATRKNGIIKIVDSDFSYEKVIFY